MKTTIYPYDVFAFFNPWSGDVLNWCDGFYSNEFNVNYSENAFEYKNEVEATGLRKKDLKITMQDHLLTVEGHRKKASGKWFKKDAGYEMNFKKRFTLPESVDESSLQAKYRDEKLTITLPKKKECIQYREIPVEGKSEAKVYKHATSNILLNKTGIRLNRLFRKAA